MLDRAELVAFVPAADLGRARHFYEAVLGLPCVDVTPVALQAWCTANDPGACERLGQP